MSKQDTRSGTIIYVNFSPYENAGKILDYIFYRYKTVLLFSFNFHHLGKNQERSSLRVYKNGSQIRHIRLFQTPTSPSTAFILLPIRSLVISLQILFHSVRLRPKYGPYDVYFTVNAFTAWTGIVMKRLRLVHKTVFWVWDYYPPVHKNKITVFMRWLYWMFDKPASLQADKTVFLHNRLITLRKSIGILPQNKRFTVVPIGTNPKVVPAKSVKNVSLVFLGVLKKSQGLDLIYDAGDILHARFPHMTLHIIGGGPDAAYYSDRAKRAKFRSVFHGYVPDERKTDSLLLTCHIGIATYIPEESNVSYYSDPSKIKKYISCGLPVVTTNVFDFSKEIRNHHAGIIIDYFSNTQLADALGTITKNYRHYQKGALDLAKKYQYMKLYQNLFG